MIQVLILTNDKENVLERIDEVLKDYLIVRKEQKTIVYNKIVKIEIIKECNFNERGYKYNLIVINKKISNEERNYLCSKVINPIVYTNNYWLD